MSSAVPDTWQDFIASPARSVALRWLCSMLDDVADEASQTALAQHPRFEQRLIERLVAQHNLTPPAALPVPAEEDIALFRLPPDAGGDLVRHCGMICHAPLFVREIRAPRVVALKERFGEAPFLAALANRDLAIVDTANAHVDDDALAHAVQRDGLACFAVWLSRQPTELTNWLRLGIADDPRLSQGTSQGTSREAPPDDLEIAPSVREKGIDIVRRAASAMLKREELTS